MTEDFEIALKATKNQPAADVQEEENILKFYYCESEDDYYLGQSVDNFYYAKYDKGLHEFIWCMSRFLPWGERVCDERVMWKEYTYPSEPIEIGCYEWLKGFIAKYITADVQEVRHGHWKQRMSTLTSVKCSECGTYHEYDTRYCPHCGARMDGKEVEK